MYTQTCVGMHVTIREQPWVSCSWKTSTSFETAFLNGQIAWQVSPRNPPVSPPQDWDNKYAWHLWVLGSNSSPHAYKARHAVSPRQASWVRTEATDTHGLREYAQRSRTEAHCLFGVPRVRNSFSFRGGTSKLQDTQKNKTKQPTKSNPTDVCSISKNCKSAAAVWIGTFGGLRIFLVSCVEETGSLPEWSAPFGPSLRQCQALMASPYSWQGTFRRVSTVQEWSLFRKCHHVGWGNLEAALFFSYPATSKSVQIDVMTSSLQVTLPTSSADAGSRLKHLWCPPVSRLQDFLLQNVPLHLYSAIPYTVTFWNTWAQSYTQSYSSLLTHPVLLTVYHPIPALGTH